jgi:alkyl sulfatase BDS1-like metallo-beta-lactamase superfamily hydrolase
VKKQPASGRVERAPDRSEKGLLADRRKRSAQLRAETKPNADVKLTLRKTTLDEIQLGELSGDDAVAHGDIQLEGNRAAFGEFLGVLDHFNFWFNIVTP